MNGEIGGLIFGAVLGIFIGGVVALWSQEVTNDSWEDGAIGVYEKTIVCEQALGEWICKRK